jgi:hypothetical protein
MTKIKELKEKAMQLCPKCGSKFNTVKVPLTDKTYYYFRYCTNLQCRYAESRDEKGDLIAT